MGEGAAAAIWHRRGVDFSPVSWKLLVARGVLGIVFGVLAMLWPLSTALALVTLWGIWALVDGIGALTGTTSLVGWPARVLAAVLGVLSIVAGIIALTRPVGTAVTLTWFLGIWLVARGVLEVVAVVIGRRTGPVLLGLIAAVLSILTGILFAANPGAAALSLAWVLGLMALIWGVVFLAAGLMLRREEDRPADAGVATP